MDEESDLKQSPDCREWISFRSLVILRDWFTKVVMFFSFSCFIEVFSIYCKVIWDYFQLKYN
ncbi:MAG: hypothetical protein ACK56F_28095, partial [bacterium]